MKIRTWKWNWGRIMGKMHFELNGSCIILAVYDTDQDP